MIDRGVKAYLLIYNPHYGSSNSLVNSMRQLADSPKFEENRTITYEYDSSIDDFMARANVTLEELNKRYGVNNTAVLWISFPQMPDEGLGGVQFLEKAMHYRSLSEVTWYMYDDARIQYSYITPEDVTTKLKLIRLEIVVKPNASYNRLDQSWINSTYSPNHLDYYDANIYDGLWVLSLSAIRANSTKPLDIMKVLPTVASEYVGATGRCTLDDTGARLGADYDIYAYFETNGIRERLVCGSYSWESKSFTWNKDLIN
jgi:hypothetical protein